jgi:hypothetical protein
VLLLLWRVHVPLVLVQLLPEWSLPESHLYIRRLPWSYNPHGGTGVGVTPGYTAFVTAVGTRHQGAAGEGAARSGADGGTVWNTVRSRTTSAEGPLIDGDDGMGLSAGHDMSFDEMLALSLAVSLRLQESASAVRCCVPASYFVLMRFALHS